MKVLIVEDSKEFEDPLLSFLDTDGHITDHAPDLPTIFSILTYFPKNKAFKANKCS